MGFYWILCVFGIICTLIAEFSKDKINKRFFLFAFFFVAFIFAALRVNIGIDYYGHYVIYEGIRKGNITPFLLEPLYLLFNLIFIETNIGYPGLVFLTSFLTLYPIYAISKKEENPFFFLFYFLLMYLIGYALIRQYLALSFEIYGFYKFYKLNKKKTGILLLFLGCCVHNSMILLLFSFCCSVIFKFNNKLTILLSLVLFIFGFFTNYILDFIFALAKNTRYGVYTEVFNSNNTKTVIGSGLGVILRFFTYYMFYFLSAKWTVNKKMQQSFNILFLCMIIADVLSLKITILLRLRFVFQAILFWPLFSYKINLKSIACISNLVLLSIFFIYLLFFQSTASWECIPYQTILFNSIQK